MMISDREEITFLFAKSLESLADKDYEKSFEILTKLYGVIGEEPKNVMPEINLTCARVAALLGNFDLAIGRALLANEQIRTDPRRYPNPNGAYLRYFAKNMLDYCCSRSADESLLDILQSIDVRFDQIDQANVSGNIKKIFNIERLAADA